MVNAGKEREIMTEDSSPNAANRSNQVANAPLQPPAPEGRDRKTGRFVKGNKSGTGNPYARRMAQLRAALFQSVTPDDVKAIAITLVDCAKTGDLTAIKMVFDYCIGRPSKDDQCDPAEDTQEDAEDTGADQHGSPADPQSTKMVGAPQSSGPATGYENEPQAAGTAAKNEGPGARSEEPAAKSEEDESSPPVDDRARPAAGAAKRTGKPTARGAPL